MALTAAGVLLLFAAVPVFTYGRAAHTALETEAAEAHEQWVEAGVDILDEQTTAVSGVLRRTFTAGRDSPEGSPELLQTLLAAALADDNAFLPFQLVGVATPSGGFTGVGISPGAGQIGIASAGDKKLTFHPWDGGARTDFGNWVVTERDWYVAGVTSPDTVKFFGPSPGLGGRPQFVAVMAEPAEPGRVWMASLPSDRIARLVETAFPHSSRFTAATAVVNPRPGGASAAGSVEIVNTPDGVPVDVVRSAATDLGSRLEHTEIRTASDGTQWRVTAGRALPGNENAIWVLASPATPAGVLDVAQYLLVALLAGVVLVALAAVAGLWPRRVLRRVAASCTSSEGVAALTPYRERISEVGDLTEAVQWGAAVFGERVRGSGLREARLVQLHIRATEAALEERRSAAQALHDGPLQTVIAAGMGLPPESVEAGYLRSAQSEMRAIANDLGPGGLPVRLAEIAAAVSDGRQFSVTMETPDVVRVSGAVGEVVLRAARELLMNARKHSGANSATATLAATNSRVRLTVIDDGVGFAATDDGVDAGGFGLFSLRVQVEQLGGTLAVNDDASAGAKVVVSLPVNAEQPVE